MQAIKTYTNIGLQGVEIIVEADSNNSIPTIEIIGLPDAAIKEAKERIKSTFKNMHVSLPQQKIILNLAPSDIRKEGTRFDLPMAVAIYVLVNKGRIHHYDKLSEYLFFGELGLDGGVKRIDGILPSVIDARKHGYKHFFVPADNVYELEYINDITIYPLTSFQQIIDYFSLGKDIPVLHTTKTLKDIENIQNPEIIDFASIKGHIVAKRALTIAAAGLHNVLMIGAPGSGKTMLAKALQGILPPMTFEEIIEVSQIYSVVGKLSKEQPLITRRPFRQVHHTASKISIVGGGRALTPGEVSLAHKGILFFDEIAEFPRDVLEVLRQPMEDKTIVISRVLGTIQYPANFMFVATMNPCKCGYYKDPEKQCTCSFNDIKRYQGTISGPLLDRIDMILEIPRETIDTILSTSQTESSKDLQAKVVKARQKQQQRFAGTPIVANAHIPVKDIDRYIPLGEQEQAFLKTAIERLSLSPRVIHRTMRLARTIADMDEGEKVEVKHLAEALQYRSKTMFVESSM